MNNKIVKKGTKIDFHIHSQKSCWTEDGVKGSNLEKCTIENIDILIEKLKSENITLFSISDHDSFDYELYMALKEKVASDECLDVLPAVEFSLHVKETKLHVVTVFNDSDAEKLSRINSLIFDEVTGQPKYSNGIKAFSIQKFSKIITEIGCDIVTIVHQKQSPNPEKPRNRDMMAAGESAYKEFISLNYFDAVEFKNPKNEPFSKIYHNKHNLEHCFITGSDCHDWNCYPHEHFGDTNEVAFSYMKALPTFKGLKMSVTDVSRLSRTDNFFPNKNYLEFFKYLKNNKEETVDLSPGINVIIGGNSTGKSAILHALTDYPKEEKKKLKKKYKAFFKEMSVEIEPQILNSKFNSQGEIRENFQNKKFDLFSNLELSVEENLVIVSELRSYCEERFSNFLLNIKYEMSLDKASTINLSLKEFNSTFNIQWLNSEKEILDKNLDKILEKISNITSEINNLTKLLEVETDATLITLLSNFKDDFEKEKIIYQNRKNINSLNNDIFNIVNSSIKSKKQEISKNSTDIDKESTQYELNKKSFINDVTKNFNNNYLLNKYTKQYNDFEDKEIKYDKSKIRDYKLYKALEITQETFEDYYITILGSLFSKNTDLENLNMLTLNNDILQYTGENKYEDIEVFLNEKFNKILKQDLITTSVIEKDKKMFHSAGFNSTMYFELLNVENKILIFDQPEDDISQSVIKSDVLKRFKELSVSNQIIFVTHNPQFIVNLDVDNLIYIENNENDFRILSGALEYEDDEYDVNIIELVANTVEGGTDSIKQRWRRYDNNKINKKC
ncbi:hypothetical protein RZE82_00280 [Mollicutes bacterium LVI A0039]|nr:hypothetical protein RZE82_00280 [Mollicutes bacterium LVI A0039]